jgi:hypothetical protein
MKTHPQFRDERDFSRDRDTPLNLIVADVRLTTRQMLLEAESASFLK